MKILLSDVKVTLLWALSGVVIGIIAFGYNYTFISTSLPGYAIFTAPARFALSFFSEETAFWPKMLIFMLGQYIGYFLMIFSVKKLWSLAKRV